MKYKFLITTLMATTALVTNAVAGGPCGGNCTWDIKPKPDGSKLLTISGTGPMTDFSDADIPWKDQFDSITSVEVQKGITSIGKHAFFRATSLTSITIPEGVTSIADYAFANASSLTSITIPKGVTSIEIGAFSGATSLRSITIPDTVTSIGIGAFMSTSLTSITIPDSVTSIGYNAFWKATSLTSITIPDTAVLQVSPSGKGPFRDLDLSNVTIHCAGVLEQCKANMAAAGYANGTYNMEQAPYSKKQADGSRAYYDANGKLTGFTGKRIYTVEEARATVEAAGTDTVNFRIRYK